MAFELTNGQLGLSKDLVNWYRNKTRQYYVYSGAAGTGKTTVIKHLLDLLGIEQHEVLSMAYVGKAVMQLARNNLNASTIHSAIYNVVFDVLYDENHNIIRDSDGTPSKGLRFSLKEKLNYPYKLLVVDEGSMVNDALMEDIFSFDIPVIIMGDMNQLPPIFGQSSIMKNPNWVLTEIMRQAEGNPIVYLSQKILNEEPIELGTYGDSIVGNYLELDNSILTDYDIILTAKNNTRESMNNYIRETLLGVQSKAPKVGEKVICRQNNWDRCIGNYYLVNGMNGIIMDINYSEFNGKKLMFDFKPDFLNETFLDLEMNYKYITSPIEDRQKMGMVKYNKFEYGYAITVHLSQGSQYNRVLYLDEKFYDKETTKKLRYTAITRAIDRINIQTKYNRIN